MVRLRGARILPFSPSPSVLSHRLGAADWSGMNTVMSSKLQHLEALNHLCLPGSFSEGISEKYTSVTATESSRLIQEREK